MRVAKMFQAVSKAGHTLVSWAAAVGQPDILELLFEHGGAPGYTDEVYTLCATVVQIVFRNWWWVGHRGPFAPSEAVAWRERALRTQFALTAAITKLRFFRRRNRLPLVEAMYNGNHRALEVFERKGIPMMHASRSWVAPKPVPPFKVPPKHLIRKPLAEVLALEEAPEGEGAHAAAQAGLAVAAEEDPVREAIEAGACGFSSTFAEIHQDVHGRVLPLLRPARPCMIATPFTQPFRNHVAVLAFGRVHLSA